MRTSRGPVSVAPTFITRGGLLVRTAMPLALLALAACGEAELGELSPIGAESQAPAPGSPTCGEQEFAVARAVHDVLIVLDRSGSMGTGLPSLWDTSRSAIYDVTSAMDDQIRFGLAVFPDVDCTTIDPTVAACDTSASLKVPIGLKAAPAIKAALSTMQACGATPTAAALGKLRATLQALPKDRRRSVLLVTDGAPNCNPGLDPWTCVCVCGPVGPPCQYATGCLDDAATLGELDALCAAGIRTHVLGLGAESSMTAMLGSMAQHGCTSVPYSATDPASVKKTLQQIAGGLVSCSFEVDCTKVQDSHLVNFYLDGALVQRSASHSGGWDWTTQCGPGVGKGLVELHGAECTAVQAGGVKLAAKYGCATSID